MRNSSSLLPKISILPSPRNCCQRVGVKVTSFVVSQEKSRVLSWSRDLIALTKPRLSLLVLLTTAVGMFLAPKNASMRPWQSLLALVSVALVVGAANAMNCYFEIHEDAQMQRTRLRPLPAGRLDANWALAIGLGAPLLALPILAVTANVLSACLTLLAYGSYVYLYTPLKKYSPWALLVGAIPGALPPTIGYTAIAQVLEPPALVLFAILFFWQLPHFLAISVYAQSDYQKAGFKTVPIAYGRRKTHYAMLSCLILQIGASLLPLSLEKVQPLYGVWALVLGFTFLAIYLRTKILHDNHRPIFFASIIYLPLLLLGLIVAW